MSLFGDYEDEMQTQPLLDDQTIESILTGRTPSNRPELDDLARLVTEVRSVASGPAPRVGAQLAAVLAGGLSTDKGDLSATAASNVPGPGNQAAGLPKRRKSMLETISAKAALAKAAAVLGGLTIATTGAAAADLLPGPAQNGVAAVIEALSLSICPTALTSARTASTDRTAMSPTTSRSSRPTSAPTCRGGPPRRPRKTGEPSARA